MNPYEIIATREHEKITLKKPVWNLIADCYAGGYKFIQGNHLFQYIKEGKQEFTQRLKRSFSFNFLQPIADTLTGFIYSTPVQRTIPAKINYIVDKASKSKSLDAFMNTVCIHSQQYPVAVLVDAPKFDPDEIKTEADRIEKVGNPYFVLYYPWQIKDFYLDDDGSLEWIILDNCQIEKDDPMEEPRKVEKYTLWTKTKFLSVKEIEGANKEKKWVLDEEYEHGLGICPVILHNFRDKDEDGISETPYENTAILSRTIYNWLSCFDEMIHSGSFKMLFVPIEKESDLPRDLISSGVASLTVFPYNGKFGSPDFKGAGLEDVTPFVTAIDMVLKQIYSAFGLDKDTDKMYVQSGVAKSKEFEKCEAFLRGGATQLEQLEIQLFRILCKMEGVDDSTIEVKYQKSFNQEEVANTLTRLYQSMMLPFQSIQDLAIQEIAKKTFNYLDQKQIDELLKKIESEKKKQPTTISENDISNEVNARKNNANTANNG